MTVPRDRALALRVSARRGTRANDERCEGRYNSAGARLFYDSVDRSERNRLR
jgi:hypothetical protein